MEPAVDGGSRPDFSTPDAFKRSVLAARSITYLDPKDGGASGIHFARMLERLGIAEPVKSKTVLAPSVAAVGTLVASGAAEIGVLQYQLLFAVPGIDVVGPLPDELQNTTIFSGAVMTGTKDADVSKALLDYLRTPEAAVTIKTRGMEPALR